MISPAHASVIAHGELPFQNPLAPATVDAVLDLLALGPGDRVLDVGCGRRELLVRIAERTGAGGIGIDTSDAQITVARAQAAARAPEADLVFEAGDAAAFAAEPASFAACACIGATHALGGLDRTIARLAELVQPGGCLLVGEGYWERPPSGALLQLLGATPDELPDFPALVAAGERARLTTAYVARTTPAEWDAYEWTYVFNLERHAQEHPEDGGALRARADDVRRRRLLAAAEGETLGFALVVWRATP